MRRPTVILLLAAVSLLIIATLSPIRPAHAALTTITFSEFPINTFINAQYSPLGVIFTGSNNGPFITTDGANPTSPVLSGDPLFQGSITAVFVTPFDPARPALARSVSFDAGYFDSIGSTTVSWYDSNNVLLGSQTNTQTGIERFNIPNSIGVFSIQVTSNEPAGYAIDNLSFEIVAQKVDITDADITNDLIRVVLSPINDSGRLVLTLIGDTNVTLFDGTLTGSGTPYEFHFNPTQLPAGQFRRVDAVWTVSGAPNQASRDVAFRVLGTYRHSQYNTPAESSCGGAPVRAFITNSSCNFNQTTLLSRFISQVNLNGSGRSINFGDVKREFNCVRQQNNPPPGAQMHSFRQAVIAPACGGALDNSTVARRPGHPYLVCGDQILIVGLGAGVGTIKTVTDLCPGCPVNQLDNYTTDPACSGITDLGRYVTIRLR